MQHRTTIHVANQKDLVLAEAGIIKQEEVRQITIKDALVDTGATRLSLPQSIVDSLGLTPTDTNSSSIPQTALSHERFIRLSNLPCSAGKASLR